MIGPPLFRLFLNEPALLAEHVAAYSELIREDAARLQGLLIRRLGYWLILSLSIVLSLIFAGMALMLHAVTSVSHWLLWVVPLLPLISASIAAWRLWPGDSAMPSFAHVRAQMATDFQFFSGKELS